MPRPLVLYHARCPDGMASAWVINKALLETGQEAEFVPMDYGSPLPLHMAGRPVYLVDYCVPQQVLEAMMSVCPVITVIDHHKTSLPVATAMRDRSPGLKFVFDAAHSGGFLCWRYCFPDREPPPIVLYTEDRDLWAWKLPHSAEVSAYLSTLPWGDFARWSAAAELLEGQEIGRYHPAVIYGKLVLECQERLIEDHLRTAFETELAGHTVRAVNCSCAPVTSELTGRLAADRPFAVSWFVRADGKAQVSLRSRGESGIDVTTVAKLYGGGGHAAAAGFQVPANALPFRVS